MSWSPSSPSPVGSSNGRRVRREQTVGNSGESFLDSEAVPSSLAEITPILRVANKVEAMNPRVAYLCRMYAYEKAQRMDPTSSGRGVRQYKTALLQRLERDKHPTWKGMVHETDALEMERFYREYYKKFIRAPQNDADNKADRALLTESYQIAASLFEVLKSVMISESAEVDIEVLHAHGKVQENKRLYEAYNILPLDPECTDQYIMHIPEVQAAVYALRDVRGLPWPNGYEKNNDLLDWLQAMFGFQKDNVSNQREHLILLLANVQSTMSRHEQQRQMAFELYGVLAGNVSPLTGESTKPAYGGDEEAFLRKVVTPIYKEAKTSKTLGSKHSNWRNYDDLNEYFWSVDCFKLRWPMDTDADFFSNPKDICIDHLKEVGFPDNTKF